MTETSHKNTKINIYLYNPVSSTVLSVNPHHGTGTGTGTVLDFTCESPLSVLNKCRGKGKEPSLNYIKL